MPQEMAANDCFLQSFELAPSVAGLHAAPGAVVVQWQTTASAAAGLPLTVSRLSLPTVSSSVCFAM